MADDDAARMLQRLLNLVDLADPARSPSEHEVASAAAMACTFVRDHRDRITFGAPSPQESTVHRLVALFQQHGIRPVKAMAPTWCLACGEVISAGQLTAHHSMVGKTHYECREWWASFDFSTLPPNPGDDVAF
jgi:hypothetical protein